MDRDGRIGQPLISRYRRVYVVPGTLAHLLPNDGVTQTPLCGYATFLRWRDEDPGQPLDTCPVCRREAR